MEERRGKGEERKRRGRGEAEERKRRGRGEAEEGQRRGRGEEKKDWMGRECKKIISHSPVRYKDESARG